MEEERNNTLQTFIGWKPEYDSHIKIVDRQHRGILAFINTWYHDIKRKIIRQENIVAYMREKFSFLEFYSKAHLAFEEKMLEILADRHRFPREELRRHLKIHDAFIREFMLNGAQQMEMLEGDQSGAFLDNLAEDSLKDVARWWYGHIRTPSAGHAGGPDHQYRLFLGGMPPEAKVDLLNDLIICFEDSTISKAAA